MLFVIHTNIIAYVNQFLSLGVSSKLCYSGSEGDFLIHVRVDDSCRQMVEHYMIGKYPSLIAIGAIQTFTSHSRRYKVFVNIRLKDELLLRITWFITFRFIEFKVGIKRWHHETRQIKYFIFRCPDLFGSFGGNSR